MECYAYKEGQRSGEDLTLAQASDAMNQGATVWLDVSQPTDEQFKVIAIEFGLHELAVEDAVKAHQRPKLELYEDTLLMVVKTVSYVNDEEIIDVGELLIFIDARFVITVRHGEGDFDDVRKRLEQRPDLLKRGSGSVLHGILDRVVDGYGIAADRVDNVIQDVEADVFSSERSNPTERIYTLDREVLEFNRAVVPLTAEVDRFTRGQFELVAPELSEYFRDIYDHLLRVGSRIDGFRDLLSGALQANLTQVSVRQNEDMRKISAWVAILAVPTMIAGIYGMNFENMPELGWDYGYPLVLALIAVISLLLYRRFKRDGWL